MATFQNESVLGSSSCAQVTFRLWLHQGGLAPWSGALLTSALECSPWSAVGKLLIQVKSSSSELEETETQGD